MPNIMYVWTLIYLFTTVNSCEMRCQHHKTSFSHFHSKFGSLVLSMHLWSLGMMVCQCIRMNCTWLIPETCNQPWCLPSKWLNLNSTFDLSSCFSTLLYSPLVHWYWLNYTNLIDLNNALSLRRCDPKVQEKWPSNTHNFFIAVSMALPCHPPTVLAYSATLSRTCALLIEAITACETLSILQFGLWGKNN